MENNDKSINSLYYLPFISILVASYNENAIIEKLLLSVYNLKYNSDKFEIIIVDDSTDDTPSILKKWQTVITNLKVIHREKREGWKGGALNLGITYLNNKSDFVLVVDADNVLEENTLKQIVIFLMSLQNKGNSVVVMQGYPISIVCDKSKGFLKQESQFQNLKISLKNDSDSNWVSRGISLRLYQRNLIEFIAKDKLGLPNPITGSLFVIKTDILKSTRFSNDLCEDWDLTLNIYLSKYFINFKNVSSRNDDHHKTRSITDNFFRNINH